MCNLGDKVKDQISGLEGIVTARTCYLYGCTRLMVAPCEHKDGKPADSFCVDEAQCVVMKPGVLKGYQQDGAALGPAGPRPSPARQPDPTR